MRVLILLLIVSASVVIYSVILATSGTRNLILTATECNTEIDSDNPLEMGVRKKHWLDSRTLYVRTYVSVNCGELIVNGKHKIVNGDTLALEYVVPKCEICGSCICGKQIEYTIRGIPKKDYNVTLTQKRPETLERFGYYILSLQHLVKELPQMISSQEILQNLSLPI